IEPPVIVVGGFQLDLARDPVSLLVGAVGAMRLLQQRRRPAGMIVAVFATLFVVGLVRGVASYGLSGHLEFSGTLWILSGVAYGASFELDAHRRRTIRRV